MSAITQTGNLHGDDDVLYQHVLASFPLCDLTKEDLTQNPQFCKLLVALTQHVDKTGLTARLQTDLDKAEQKLQSRRRQWLRSEILHRSQEEMIQDYRIQKREAAAPPDQSSFHEVMAKCLLVAQCVRQLDPSDTADEEKPLLLGLDPQDVLALTPPEKCVQKMREVLPKHLEKHLRDKCLNLLSYYQPQGESESEGLKTIKLFHLSALLEKEKSGTESLKETCRENTILLQRQSQLYLSELIKCIRLLQTLILDHRLRVQTDLDQKKLDYFEGKCELVFLKIKTEMGDIQLDTYTPDTISAHRKIRHKLDSELQACKADKQAIQSKLSSFEILGKEFEVLADEYCRLRREIETKNWALKEFTHYQNI